MISVLAQERLLGFALGTVSMGAFVLHQRRAIYRSLVDVDVAASGSPFSYQLNEIGSRKSSTDLAHVWNKTVDETLGRLVVYLSSRGWPNTAMSASGGASDLKKKNCLSYDHNINRSQDHWISTAAELVIVSDPCAAV
ncbi:hypothetical protein ABZP36_029258 [Zizania latifolia]